jgi:hypothetical protein
MNSLVKKIKYPKLFLLIITFIVAYIIFYERDIPIFHDILFSLGYFGTLIAGILFTYGFTAAPATIFLILLAQNQNIILSAFIGGIGAMIGDYLIFKLIRHSFHDEIEKLRNEKIMKHISKKSPSLVKKYFLPVIAGFIIASPLPDEMGVALLATSKIISSRMFFIISFLLNTTGIFIIIWLSQVI